MERSAVPSEPRHIAVFFYGLFMDAEALTARGFRPGAVVRARLDRFAIRVGERATVMPMPGSTVHGVVMDLTHAEVRRLYSDAGLEAYHPEAVLVETIDGAARAALCFTLPEPPTAPSNPVYAAKLRALAQRIGLPPSYVASIGRTLPRGSGDASPPSAARR